MSDNLDIKSFLQTNGYPVKDCGNEILSKCLWRGGQNWNLSVNKNTGFWFDFVTSDGGNFEKLAARIGVNPADTQNFSFENLDFVDELKLPKNFNIEILNSLDKNHEYWENRGISHEVLQEFGGGLANPEIMPKLVGRYILPIISPKGVLEGFSARYTGNNKEAKKQKILGVKSNFVFPLYLNRADILETKKIYLVEGGGDLLTLFTCGFRNCLATFGTHLSKKLLSAIIGLGPREIIICENNDPINEYGNRPGQEAALKIKTQLLNFFDNSSVKIINPTPYKDLNDGLMNAGPEFIQNLLRDKSI